MRRYDPISRRLFLRGASGFALALPALPSLLEREAQAAFSVPLRFVQVFNHYGPFQDTVYPDDEKVAAGMTAFNGAPHVYYKQMERPQYKEGPLYQNGPTIKGHLRDNYDPILSKINLIRGMDVLTQEGHNEGMTVTGGTYRYSIDVVIEQAPSMYADTTPAVRALRLAPAAPDLGEVNSFYQKASIDAAGLSNEGYSYYNPQAGIPSETDAKAVFDRLFRNFNQAPQGNVDASAVEKKVVDLVLEDYRALQNAAYIGSEDRMVISRLLDMLSEIENRLLIGGSAGVGCSAPQLIEEQTNEDRYLNHFQILAAALLCDLTRVGVVVLEDQQSQGRMHDEDFHSLSHDWPTDQSQDFYFWKYNQFARLVNLMSELPEANGLSLLDNTITYFANDSTGPNHFTLDLPVLTAGTAQGKLKSGYYIDYRTRPFVPLSHPTENSFGPSPGRPIPHLFQTFLQVLGIPPEEYEREGNAGFGQYDPTKLTHHISPGGIPYRLITESGDRVDWDAPAYYNEFLSSGPYSALPFLLNA